MLKRVHKKDRREREAKERVVTPPPPNSGEADSFTNDRHSVEALNRVILTGTP